jgi:hypothetical protein
MFETRVFVRRRGVIRPKDEVKAEFLAPLAGLFLPVVIEKLIGTAASAFKKAGEDKITRDSGRCPTYLYELSRSGNSSQLKLNPEFKSVIVVRGSFDKTTGKTPDTDKSSSVTALRAAGILVRELGLVYEAQMEIADDGTALRYESRYFEVSRFMGDQDKSKEDRERGIVLNLTLTGVGEKEGEPVLSTAMINLGECNGGAIFNTADLISKQSSWLGGLALSDASVKAIENMNPVGNSVNVMPVTLEVTIAETENGNAALKFIGEVLDATKGDVAKTVSGEVLGGGKKEEAAKSALEKLLAEEETAFQKLLEAELAFTKLPAPDAQETDAQKKERSINRFAIETAGRAWCVKFGALQQLGRAPLRPDHTCPVKLP